MQKKNYSTPTVTEHGNAIDNTKGVAGAAWEMWGGKHDAILIPIETENPGRND